MVFERRRDVAKEFGMRSEERRSFKVRIVVRSKGHADSENGSMRDFLGGASDKAEQKCKAHISGQQAAP